jgi:3-oxoacyl-[acyl-carrier-protein] synthase-3
MPLFSIPGIRISAVSAAVPAQKVSNLDLENFQPQEREELIRRTGIRLRRVAPPDMCASDLCAAAASRILDSLQIAPESIGALVCVTQTPDYPLPGNSMLLQQRLGLSRSAFLLDINQGCAGYVYGMATLAGMMHATGIERGLLLVGDTITRWLSDQDRSTRPIFSDAGSATLLEKSREAAPFYFNLGAEGAGASIIQVQGGGARHPFGADSLTMADFEPGVRRAPVHLAMHGIDVLNYSFRHVVPNIKELLEAAGWGTETPDYYLLHQANQILNQSLVKKLGISGEKAPETLSLYGNTSCATIPVTLCSRLSGVLDSTPKKLLFSGFGVGFSWGSMLTDAGPMLCPDIIEI